MRNNSTKSDEYKQDLLLNLSQVIEPSTKDNLQPQEFTNVPEGTELESYTVVRQWKPLIVIGNRKSGNNDGAAILASFRSHLNPAQVGVLQS